MSSSLLLIYIASAVISIIGLSLLVMSIVPPWRRGEPMFSTFWAPREMFRGREFLYNRVGFWLSMIGIAMAVFVVFQLRG